MPITIYTRLEKKKERKKKPVRKKPIVCERTEERKKKRKKIKFNQSRIGGTMAETKIPSNLCETRHQQLRLADQLQKLATEIRSGARIKAQCICKHHGGGIRCS